MLTAVGAWSAEPKQAKPSAALTAEGEKLKAEYDKTLDVLVADIKKAIPTISEAKIAAFSQARDAVQKAAAGAEAAQAELGKISQGKTLIDHAKGKWIGGAEKGIAQAQAALKKATTDAEKAAAQKQLATSEADKQAGLSALKERTEAYEKAKADEPALRAKFDAAQAALTNAKADEVKAAKALTDALVSVIGSDKLDAKTVKANVITHATPQGLAAFAEKGAAEKAAVTQLLADDKLMKEMLVAGGARYGKYGEAMKIYTEIQKASPKAKSDLFQRLALATSLEHANPIAQNNDKALTDAPKIIDPVKRYLHYEKAYLDGDLDAAFKDLSAWEYRFVINCDAPDEIITWGRKMLQTYRPDHIYLADYGWRYVASVKTEVPYGSENVKYDLDTLHQYQNIAKNAGICGRRAFFGRFMLRSFGIPTWGVTQKAHAALSHWTPKGWVVNLGAGYAHSWWDRDDVSLSGNQFLLETQAREHTDEYLKVLRAEWIGRILGEPAYNERKKIAGGFWSNLALYESRVLAAKAAALGPLGQELAEANEKEQKVESAAVTVTEQKITVKDGMVSIPAVAGSKNTGKSAAMKSFRDSGMQLHALGGFKTEYEFEAPAAGKYTLTAKVATIQEGQIFILSANSAQPAELPVPYTLGAWQNTKPLPVTLEKGKNTLSFELKTGSRGVTIKDFTLTPVK
jgi:chemotaxis protein histidine kinase CheA